MQKDIIEILKNGGVVVMPTDTLYGLVASAFHRDAVERVYDIKKRNPNKACIVLLGDFQDLELFHITLTPFQKDFLQKHWPAPLSVILPLVDEGFSYIHRGEKSIAFRLPADLSLRRVLHQTGPIIAPSANPEGQPPAQTITEAREYFGGLVDGYVNKDVKEYMQASTLVRLDEASYEIIRQGDYMVGTSCCN